MRTRGAHSWVRNTATGLPDWLRVGEGPPGPPSGGPKPGARLARGGERLLLAAGGGGRAGERVEGAPAPRRPPGPAVDDERVRVLGHLGIEVVHQHPQGGF